MSAGKSVEAGPELFTCGRMSLRLTPAGCSRLWLSAQDKDNAPKSWEGRSACVTCPIGAANSGREISPVAADVAAIKGCCARCLRRTDRLIKGLHCVSCYNRQAEADKGRNRKGTKPRLCAQLHDAQMAVTVRVGIQIISAQKVIGVTEVILAAARHAEDVLHFGWSSAGPGDIVALLV